MKAQVCVCVREIQKGPGGLESAGFKLQHMYYHLNKFIFAPSPRTIFSQLENRSSGKWSRRINFHLILPIMLSSGSKSFHPSHLHQDRYSAGSAKILLSSLEPEMAINIENPSRLKHHCLRKSHTSVHLPSGK